LAASSWKVARTRTPGRARARPR